MNLFGVVLGIEPSRGEGWYRVRPSINEPDMVGVSIKGTALSIGQTVAIVQSGGWQDSRRGFAFAETTKNIWSSVEMGQSKNSLIDQAPVGALLAYLSHKAGRVEELYRPARVVSVTGSGLNLKDWYTNASIGVWPVADDLAINDFSVGDGVLCRLAPEQLRRVEGWWETYKSLANVIGGLYFIPGIGSLWPIRFTVSSHSFEIDNDNPWTEDLNMPDPKYKASVGINIATGMTELIFKGANLVSRTISEMDPVIPVSGPWNVGAIYSFSKIKSDNIKTVNYSSQVETVYDSGIGHLILFEANGIIHKYYRNLPLAYVVSQALEEVL